MTQFKFTVYRDSWYRGQTGEESTLSDLYPNKEGKSCRKGCCLGHAVNEFGIGLDVIDTISEISELDLINKDKFSSHPFFKALLKAESTAIDINDDPSITDQVREEKLEEHFLNHDIDVRFVDGKREWKKVSEDVK